MKTKKLLLLLLIVVTAQLTGQERYTTFGGTRIGFRSGVSQQVQGRYNLRAANRMNNVRKIEMVLYLDCDGTSPTGYCGTWDVIANVAAKDPSSGQLIELGRYVTPYGTDNSQRSDGFRWDVTDFKSILQGSVDLSSYIEIWTQDDGWNITVEFLYYEGTPDYTYYNVAPLLEDYNSVGYRSFDYGNGNDATVVQSVSIPSNAQQTKLRHVIQGWGHTTPAVGGGNCAEWCDRRHTIAINGANTFNVDLIKDQNCAGNPIQPQARPGYTANWSGERSGWCPGKEVPVRNNYLSSTYAGSSFEYNFKFQPYTKTGSTTSSPDAWYHMSAYVIVKSNTPIGKPSVTRATTCYEPTPYVASKGQTNINVGWYNTNANSYALYYKKDSAGSWTWGGYHNGLSANITGLSASTKYNIDVYSVCSNGSWILGDRLTVTTSGSSSGGGGGSNIAQGKPFGVSSTYGSGYEGWRSNDGNGNTRWASSASGATTQQYVYYDLGAYYNISSVRLYFENAYSKNFNIQIGVNGYWQNVTGLTNNSNLSPGLGINRTARWIRFVSTNHPRTLVSIWEFEVQGTYAYAGKKANGKESVPLEPLGLNDVTFNKEVKVFPNPANSTFNIALKGFKKANITISDLLGKTVYKTSTTNSEISLTKGNTFKTGMYIIKVLDENNMQYISKLVIN